MSHLQVVSKWNDNINQVETTEPIMGGPNGNANLATRQLAENLFWLKNKVEGIPISTATDGFEQNLSQNGYCKLPNGLILQWGFIPLSQMRDIHAPSLEKSAVVNLPTAFQHRCLNATATIKATKVGYFLDLFTQVVAFDNTSLTLQTATTEVYNIADGYDGVFWQAIGF